MQYFTERGYSHNEVIQKIRDKYGLDAQILNHTSISLGGFLGFFTREGVEVSGYVSDEKAYLRRKQLEDAKTQIIAAASSAASSSERSLPPSSPGFPSRYPASQTPGQPAVATAVPAGQKTAPRTQAAAPVSEPDMDQILKELKTIRESVLGRDNRPEQERHPHLIKIEELLEENDFSSGLIRELCTQLKDKLSLSSLEDFDLVQEQTVKWICDKIKIQPPVDKKGPRRVVLIGPTGVGKTTTVAKFAGRLKKEGDTSGHREVRLITIDNYRIGAFEQLKTYADIMEIPLAQAGSRQEMKEKADLFSQADWILVDTTGRSPRDYENLAQMRKILEPLGSRTEYFLLISAATKASDVRDILKEFESFGYQSLILTKLDETHRIGNILSVLAETGKPLSYITSGQSVPAGIEKATKTRLIKNLDNFTINIEKLKSENYLEKGE